MVKRPLKLFKNGEKGFTLIELLVVIAILGCLAGIAMPNILSLINAGDIAAARGEAHTLYTAVEAYAAVNKAFPADVAAVSGYIRGEEGAIKGTYAISNGTIEGSGYWTQAPRNFVWDNNTWNKP